MNPSTFPQVSPSSLLASKPQGVTRVFDGRPFRVDGEVLALTFTATGLLLSVEERGIVRCWDLSNQKQLAWRALSQLDDLWVFNQDGTLLASASDELSLWDVPLGQLRAVLLQPSWVTALGLRADGAVAATGHDEGTVRLWDLAHDNLLWEKPGHQRQVSALAFSADGKFLATVGEERNIRLWEVASGQECGLLEGPHDRIPALVWHPRGHRLYSAGWDTSVWVWDIATRSPIILLNSHANQIYALSISSDGEYLACADSAQAVYLWDLSSHRILRTFRGFEGEVRSLAFSPGIQFLVSGGSDRAVRVWDLRVSETTAEIIALDWDPSQSRGPETHSCLALSPDGDRLVSLSPGVGLQVWEVGTERKVLNLAESSRLCSVAFSPGGDQIAAGGEGQILFWEAATGQRLETWEGPNLPVTALAYAARTPVLASASALGCDVWLWSTDLHQPIFILPDAVEACAITALAFSPSEDCLAVGGIDWLATSGSDGAVHVWDLARKCRVARLPGGARHLAFHPEGIFLATASLVQSVCLWDVSTEKLVAELTGHEDAVTCVAFSSDGRWLASGGDDQTIRLWDALSGKFKGKVELDTQVKTLSFSPDSQALFTGNGNTSCYQISLENLLAPEEIIAR